MSRPSLAPASSFSNRLLSSPGSYQGDHAPPARPPPQPILGRANYRQAIYYSFVLNRKKKKDLERANEMEIPLPPPLKEPEVAVGGESISTIPPTAVAHTARTPLHFLSGVAGS